jgi:hypothetical protein
MASDLIRGCAFVVEVGPTPTLIGGGENAVLTQSQETGRIVTKDNCLSAQYVAGQGSWTLVDDGVYLVGSNLVHTETMSLSVGATPSVVKGINDLTLSTNFGLLEASNTTSGLDRSTEYGIAEHTLDFAGEFYGPLDDPDNVGLELLETSVRDSAAIPFEFDFGSVQNFQGSAIVSSFVLSAPAEGYTTYTGTLTITGNITSTTTGADAGLALVIDAVYNTQAKLVVKLTTNINPNDEWTGTAVAANFVINATFGADVIRASATFEGDGVLVRSVTPV